MLEIHYAEVFILITIIWLAGMLYRTVKNKRFDTFGELKLLTVYICFTVVARITLFPWHLVDGHIGTLVFDKERIVPLNMNLMPIVHMFDVYDGWKMNLIGNITMFIPVGIFFPLCFRKLDNIGKTTLSGTLFSLCIEIIQLPFYDRCTDVDDIILNTIGMLIGAVVFFGIRGIVRVVKKNKQRKSD